MGQGFVTGKGHGGINCVLQTQFSSYFYCLATFVFFLSFLVHLARRAIVSYCHSNASGVRRASTLENKYSNIFFYKTTRPTALKFHMEHHLTPASQNCKIGSGRISKMAAVTKYSKNNKINFFSTATDIFG